MSSEYELAKLCEYGKQFMFEGSYANIEARNKDILQRTRSYNPNISYGEII